MLKTIGIYFILFIFYSFIGWLYEVILGLVQDKKFVNRGFYVGPLCPIYGVGGLLMILLLSPYKKDPITLMILSVTIFATLEYLTSYLMEKLFKARWWDYSDLKFNVNGRICLIALIPFMILGAFAIYVLHPFLFGLLTKFSSITIYIIAGILALIFILDMIVSFTIIIKYKVTYNNNKLDATEEINERIRKIFEAKGSLHKRLMQAFPHAKIIEKKIRKVQKGIKKFISNE